MSNRDEDIARQITDGFRASLNETARANITAAEFEQLEASIRRAVSKQLAVATDLMQETINQLRRQIEKPEIEL